VEDKITLSVGKGGGQMTAAGGLLWPKSAPPPMSIAFSQKYIHNIYFLELSTICQYVHLFPSNEPTNLVNEKR
jgi:hypothetical protein